MVKKTLELKPEQLRWQCDPGMFKFKTTADIKRKDGDHRTGASAQSDGDRTLNNQSGVSMSMWRD